MKIYKHQFEKSPARKGNCPACEARGTFRYYEGLPRVYGKCERENNCNYHKKPDQSILVIAQTLKDETELKIIYPDSELCDQTLNNQDSNFHVFCREKLAITPEHLKNWNVGSRLNDHTKIIETGFVYQNVNQKYVNIKHFEYNRECKRNKKGFPYCLKPKEPNTKYSICLFGEQVLSTDKIICLVESEKTAVIASFFYSQFDWLATGGKNGLTDDKIHVLYGREIYYLSDADLAGNKNSTLDKLEAYKQNFKKIELFPNKTDGYDIADALIEGLKPEIKFSESSVEITPTITTTPVQKISERHISKFEEVENYLTDLFDIRYNEVSAEVEFSDKGKGEFKQMNENNIFRLLQHNHIKFSLSNISCLLHSDFVPVHNPFKDYFESLPKWNETTDVDYIDKLAGYIKAKDPERFKRHLKKMLVRSIACGLLDTVFNKHAFILVHDKQSSGKTTFLRWLCPPVFQKYYTETYIVGKDGEMSLSDNIFINLDELSTLSRQDINALKSSFSRVSIRQRRPFDRTMTNMIRRANFVGSTNKDEFLTDETGSVRWLCFEIENINWDYSKDVDINSIWSQAYALFSSGFKYELTADEIIENETANNEYQIRTPELDLIQKHYCSATKEQHEIFYTASEIQNALSSLYPNLRLNSNSIGKALKLSGFERNQKYNGIHQIKGYYINLIKQIP